MRLLRPFVPLFASALLSVAAMAATPQATPRIVDAIDDAQLVRLAGNTHPLATARNDAGRLAASRRIDGLVLVLNRGTAMQTAFDQYIASQYDANSANYHHWLTPVEIGQKFGPAQADVDKVTSWLSSEGFAVESVSPDRMSIQFSGTTGQIESAFHTEMHALAINGQTHIANMSDPSIPTALAPVVLGVKQLHDFQPQAQHRRGSQVIKDESTGLFRRVAEAATTHPQWGNNSSGSQTEDLAPADFATIYNVTPVYNQSVNGQKVTGTGQTIAIAGTSLINASDVTAFRTLFGLPTTGTYFNQISVNAQASTCTASSTSKAACTIDDMDENTLDVQWSGAVAPGATVNLYVTGATGAVDTVWSSANYVVNTIYSSTSPRILSVSYGECELGLTASGNASYYNLWKSAAAEGISVFVSTGDSGSAGCDQGQETSLPYGAQYGLSVSGIASTPYNTAVGGTDFTWCQPSKTNSCSTGGSYWNPSNNSTTQANAKSYIPEIPWNSTCANPYEVAYINSFGYSYTGATLCNDIDDGKLYSSTTSGEKQLQALVDVVGGSGGKSNCVSGDGTNLSSCNVTGSTTASSGAALFNNGYVKPSWQSALTPADGVRDIPDVSFFASSGFLGSAYLVCNSSGVTGGNCSSITGTNSGFFEVGGTSASTPAMAGVMALINQFAGSAQGLANPALYSLAAKQASTNCSSESVSNAGACYFNDVDQGTIAVPCVVGSTNCTGSGVISLLSGYDATSGYDLATGLGSLNVYNVVNAWPTSTVTLPTPTVTVTPNASSINSGAALPVSITVANANGTVAASGTVSLTAGTYTKSATLTNGAASITIPAFAWTTAGTKTISVSYAGDSNYSSASGSGSVTVVASTFTLSATDVTTTAGTVRNSTITVTPVNGYTGTVALSAVVTSSPSNAVGTPTFTYTQPVAISSTAAVTGTVAVTTNAATASMTQPALWFRAAGSTALAAMLLLVLPKRRRKIWQSLGAVLLVASLALTAVGCGGGNGGGSSTPTKLTPTVTVTASKSSVAQSGTLTLNVTVTGSGAAPTGSVSVSGDGASGSATLASGAASISASGFTSTGAQTLTVTYGGDSVYNSGAGTAAITVTPSATTPGTYTVTVTGTDATNNLTATTTFTLTVK